MTSPTRPVLRWHGGKWRLAPWILQHMPKHRVYVEPFGGGASVMLQKARVQSEIYNDLDRSLVNLFTVCRDRPDELIRAVALTPYARGEYERLYRNTKRPVEAARRFVIRSFMGQNSKGAFALSGFDTRMNDDLFISRVASVAALPETIAQVAGRLVGVVIERSPAEALMPRFDSPETLFFCDPPYVHVKRRRTKFNHDMTVEQHRQLLTCLRSLRGMVVLSGYASPLYDELLPDWKSATTEARTDGGHKRIEVLWLNPACVAALEAEQMPLFREAS